MKLEYTTTFVLAEKVQVLQFVVDRPPDCITRMFFSILMFCVLVNINVVHVQLLHYHCCMVPF